jgi:hypothetical protein
MAASAGLTLILLLTVAVTAPRLLPGGDRSAAGAGDQDRSGRLVRVAMEPWQVARLDGRRLVVRFPGGPPGAPVDSCSPAYEATVSDDAQLVHVTVHLLLPPKMLPCRTMNHQRTLTVALPKPLRGRPLVDGGSGDARMLLGAVVREPSYLPPGYQQGGYAAGFLRQGHRMAAWQRVQRRAHAAHDQLWITQGHPAAVSLRYHPPPGAAPHQRARLPGQGVEAGPRRRPERPVPVLGRRRDRLPALQRRQADPAAGDRRARAGRRRAPLASKGKLHEWPAAVPAMGVGRRQ